MTPDHHRRLRRLEASALPCCSECSHEPVRIVGTDELTDRDTSATMPPSGCDTCGRPPRVTIAIPGVDVARL